MLARPRQLFRNWAARRSPQSGTLILTQRRVYIVPSRQGLVFVVVLFAMLLCDINYNLSLGYVLTFALAMLGVLSMLYTFRNLAGLHIRAGHIAPVFTGDTAEFVFYFDNPDKQTRYQLHLHNTQIFDLPPRHTSTITLPIPSVQRGWLDSGRLSLHSEFPLGLFHAWTYLHFDTRALIYPQPAAARALPATTSPQGVGALSNNGDEDFFGLRNYVAGDALPRIAWKALAREQGLQVKQFSARLGQECWLDWSSLAPLDDEARLSVLTRWVLDADAQGVPYGLRLPDGSVSPQHHPAHRAECLRRLALFGLAP